MLKNLYKKVKTALKLFTVYRENKYLVRTAVDATNYMTLYMKIVSEISKKQMRVIRILGRLLTNKTHNEKGVFSIAQIKATGTLVHYSIGIFFLYCYHLLWKNRFTKPNLTGGVTLGLTNGLIAIAVWYVYMNLHRNPPKIDRKSYLINLVIAHIIYGTVAAFEYNRRLHLSEGKSVYNPHSGLQFLS
ncbi:MAG: hypothetical protein J7604_22125 [Sporocytophaga sp.]|uniref:hypothetical protein n=1 Tax=Sporocytophaga sp. TaxID=2231183 RepID=UPI001B027CA6|nr:hypothetical protein [Sporocytophaga sp.]MBO9702928.1 hypothetical protein [Sporocytophaga sp.]